MNELYQKIEKYITQGNSIALEKEKKGQGRRVS